jgi:hypothetical protein
MRLLDLLHVNMVAQKRPSAGMDAEVYANVLSDTSDKEPEDSSKTRGSGNGNFHSVTLLPQKHY